MCDQEVPADVETIFRKPLTDWSDSDRQQVQLWIDEAPVPEHRTSRESYITLAETGVFFKSGKLWTKRDSELVATWLCHRSRQHNFIRRAKTTLKQHNYLGLFDSKVIETEWPLEFISELFSTRYLNKYDSNRCSLYGYISVKLPWWVLDKCKAMYKLRQWSPENGDDNDIDELAAQWAENKGIIGQTNREQHILQPEQYLLESQRTEQLRKCVEALSPTLFETMKRHLADESDRDIAQALSISEGTVRTRLTRARQLLSDMMAQT